MQIDPMKRVDELEQRIMDLEKRLEEKRIRKIRPIQILGEAFASLLFGVLIVGPLITVVVALFVFLMSYINP